MSLIERKKQRAKEEKAAMAAVAADVERFKREEEAKRERQRAPGGSRRASAHHGPVESQARGRRRTRGRGGGARRDHAAARAGRLEKAAKVEKLKKDAYKIDGACPEQDATTRAPAARRGDARKQAEYDALLEAQERQRRRLEFHAKIGARARWLGRHRGEGEERENATRNS